MDWIMMASDGIMQIFIKSVRTLKGLTTLSGPKRPYDLTASKTCQGHERFAYLCKTA